MVGKADVEQSSSNSSWYSGWYQWAVNKANKGWKSVSSAASRTKKFFNKVAHAAGPTRVVTGVVVLLVNAWIYTESLRWAAEGFGCDTDDSFWEYFSGYPNCTYDTGNSTIIINRPGLIVRSNWLDWLDDGDSSYLNAEAMRLVALAVFDVVGLPLMTAAGVGSVVSAFGAYMLLCQSRRGEGYTLISEEGSSQPRLTFYPPKSALVTLSDQANRLAMFLALFSTFPLFRLLRNKVFRLLVDVGCDISMMAVLALDAGECPPTSFIKALELAETGDIIRDTLIVYSLSYLAMLSLFLLMKLFPNRLKRIKNWYKNSWLELLFQSAKWGAYQSVLGLLVLTPMVIQSSLYWLNIVREWTFCKGGLFAPFYLSLSEMKHIPAIFPKVLEFLVTQFNATGRPFNHEFFINRTLIESLAPNCTQTSVRFSYSAATMGGEVGKLYWLGLTMMQTAVIVSGLYHVNRYRKGKKIAELIAEIKAKANVFYRKTFNPVLISAAVSMSAGYILTLIMYGMPTAIDTLSASDCSSILGFLQQATGCTPMLFLELLGDFHTSSWLVGTLAAMIGVEVALLYSVFKRFFDGLAREAEIAIHAKQAVEQMLKPGRAVVGDSLQNPVQIGKDAFYNALSGEEGARFEDAVTVRSGQLKEATKQDQNTGTDWCRFYALKKVEYAQLSPTLPQVTI